MHVSTGHEDQISECQYQEILDGYQKLKLW